MPSVQKLSNLTKKQLLFCSVAIIFVLGFISIKSSPNSEKIEEKNYLSKHPWKKEMLAFRNVCEGWKDDHALRSTVNLFDVQFQPEDEIPKTWTNDPEAIKAFENYCTPYTFMRFIPTPYGMFRGVEHKVKKCTAPPLKGEYCEWYPICMIDPLKDAISQYVNSTGFWEENHLRNVRAELERNGGPEKVFMMDAGCNEGIYTIWAAVLGYKVISFEANTNLMPLLRKSFSLAGISKRITMFNNAISHTIGDVILEEVPGNVGASSISALDENNKNKKLTTIKKITLDDTLEIVKEKHPNLRLGYMKIDIEGHEAKLFTGGVDFMSYYFPKSFQMEINTMLPPNIWTGCNCELFESIFEKLNYSRRDVFWKENTTFCQKVGSFGDSFFKRP